jgi:hypothetical protein
MAHNRRTPLEAIAQVIHDGYECAILLLEQHGSLDSAIRAAEATAARRDIPTRDRRMARRAGFLLASHHKQDPQAPRDEILDRLRAAQEQTLAGDPPEDGFETVFAETTVQWEKFMKGAARRRTVLSAIAETRCFTSTYVLAEVDVVLGNYFRIFRHMAGTADSLSALFVGISQGYVRWPLFPKTAWLIWNAIKKEERERGAAGSPMSESEQLAFAVAVCERYLNAGIEHGLNDHMDAIVESFRTHVTLGEPLWYAGAPEDDPIWGCPGRDGTCQLPWFVCQNADAFLKILHTLTARRARRGGIGRCIQALQDIFGQQGNQKPPDYDAARGRNCCALSDAIIAVECPHCAQLYTTDKHFDVLCPALGKRRWIPPSQRASGHQPSAPAL